MDILWSRFLVICFFESFSSSFLLVSWYLLNRFRFLDTPKSHAPLERQNELGTLGEKGSLAKVWRGFSDSV